MKPVSLYGKDILTLADFNVDEYNLILDTAREMKNIINPNTEHIRRVSVICPAAE